MQRDYDYRIYELPIREQASIIYSLCESLV